MIAPDAPAATVTRAAELLHTYLGMRLDPSMLGRLRRCIRDESTLRGQDAAAYVETLAIDAPTRQALFDSVTVQETSFFRHPGQFTALANYVLPSITGPVNIWSAACANGQEAYSLAMVLEEQARDGSVTATDVSTRALRRTDAARYRGSEISGLSAERRVRHLTGGPDEWEVCAAVRSRVHTRHHNLVTDELPAGIEQFHVVFCRNVLIYFSPLQSTAFLTRLADRLAPGACLFLGYAETIWQVTDRFEPVRILDSFEYHRRRATPMRGVVPTPVATPAPSARERPEPRPRPEKRSPPVSALSDVAQLTESGQEAAARGDHAGAVTAFRKCVYLEPSNPMGHVNLGLAFEASGDAAAAARAFLAARAALDSSDPDDLAVALGGYGIAALRSLLDSKRQVRCP